MNQRYAMTAMIWWWKLWVSIKLIFFCKWHDLQNMLSVMNKDEGIKKFKNPKLTVKIGLI